MSTRNTGYLASNPVIVGAATTLVVILAVFLAYNANSGLPFVPTYDLNAQVPNAEALVRGNEVRIGGVRVGRVAAVTAEPREDGTAVANIEMNLDEQVQPLPADSTMIVRTRSALGLKYLEITPGDSEQGIPPGRTIPVAQATPDPVELDDFFNAFNEPTREGVQGNLRGFGTALAGRGADLNAAIGALRPLVESALPAARNLADRDTNLGGFWRALSATATELAPVAAVQAALFVALERTFAAFAEVARPYIEQTISRSPDTLEEGIRSLPEMRPFLRHSEEFFVALRPGAEALGETSPVIADALQVGTPVLRRSPRLNRELAPTAQAVLDFQNTAGVPQGIELLSDTNRILDPTLRFLVPAQTRCEYLTILFSNVASVGSMGDGDGNKWQRFLATEPPKGPDNEGIPAAEPADGGGPDRANHLHYNPYPYTGAPGQPGCEAGREPYAVGSTVIGNSVPGP